MDGELIGGIIAQLKSIPDLKFVDLWRNQFSHSNDPDKLDENSFSYPAAFVEIKVKQAQDIADGIQLVNFTCTVHIGTEAYNGPVTDIWDLRAKVYRALHFFQFVPQTSQNYADKFLHRDTRPVPDYDNINTMEIDFDSMYKDYSAQQSTPVTSPTNPVITTNYVNTLP